MILSHNFAFLQVCHNDDLPKHDLFYLYVVQMGFHTMLSVTTDNFDFWRNLIM